MRIPRHLIVFPLIAALALAAGCSNGGGKPSSAAAPARQTPPTPLPVSAAATSAAKPSTTSSASGLPDVAAETADAVKAAAVPYPGAKAVKPETLKPRRVSRKLVAITLDDGIPFDTRILDLFEKENVRATTFLLGQAVVKHPDLVARLNRDGFEIANHTWDHKTLTKLSDAQIRTELAKTQKAISDITGNQAPYMRPPGGGTNARVKAVAASMGYKVVMWNKSFADTSKFATPQKLYHNVMDGLKPGDIILCHWGGKDTYEALQLILPELARRGYETVPLSELMRYSAAK